MKEPPVRNAVVVSVVLIVAILLGGLAGFLTRDEPVDLRWATWSQPILIGELDETGGVIRDTSGGVPMSNSDGTVDLAFHRCGPVEEVPTTSARTWVVRSSESEFIGFEGQTLAVDILEANDCVTFNLNYPIPDDVREAAAAEGATIELRFTIEPIDPKLGQIIIGSEPFILYDQDLDQRGMETVPIE